MKDRTCNLLGALSLAVMDRLTRASSALLGHGGETVAALLTIGGAPGMSNDRLRQILGLSHPGAVRLIDRLSEQGFVERRRGRDARAVALHLTMSGEAMRQTLRDSRMSVANSILQALDQDERLALGQLLHKILANLPSSELEACAICRLCDEKTCEDCPLGHFSL